ncbi:MAG: hypothetical protein IPK13_17900 [Deltaproteobacteria bacterium]|nr:hypothetical protein [Deltaproteobacteria bacterium]
MSSDDDAAKISNAIDEERRQNRPYRRLVGILFGVAILALVSLFLRGIVRTLDRLPSASVEEHHGAADVRALRACADDLEKLELQIRKSASALFAQSVANEANMPDWRTIALPFEVERLNISARCGLDADGQENPAVRDLALASSEIEALLRAYALLYDRHRDDGAKRSREARHALDRALKTLESKPEEGRR